MFTRPESNYVVPSEIIEGVTKDESQPINRITEIISDHSKVMDIGAGNGLLAKVFKYKKKDVIIDGIEPNKFAYDLLKPFYRKTYNGLAQDFWDEIKGGNYDYIVLADVIEHIPDPLIFLDELIKVIDNRTKIVISTPNVAFGALRISLLNGEFNYVDSGLLEKTHMRFFTYQTLNKMFTTLKLGIEKEYFLQRNLYSTEINITKFKYQPVELLIEDELAHVYQFLFILTKNNNVKTERKLFGQKLKTIEKKDIIKSKLNNIIKIFLKWKKH